MIAALDDPSGGAEFRAGMLELLFKRNARAADERIEKALARALADAEPSVRVAAVYGFALYLRGEKLLRVLDLVDDADPEVRRQVYLLLNSEDRRRRGRGRGRRHGRGPRGPWGLVSEDSRADIKARIIAAARARATGEIDAELKLLARAVVGREVDRICGGATEAAQRSDLARAEEFFRNALELDPDSHLAKIRFVRHVLAQGERERALSLAGEHGALIRVPMLASAPVIDGDPTDEVWNEGFRDHLRYRSSSRWASMPVEGRSEMRIGHRDGKLYVAVIAYEDDLTRLIVKHKTRDSEVWRDDCVEFMFDPANTARPAYRIIVNAGGIRFDSHQRRRDRNFEFDSAVSIFEGRGYWACELAVAAAEFGDAAIAADSIWGMNIVRTRIGAAEQHIWWPTYGKSENYHLHPLAVFEFPEGAAGGGILVYGIRQKDVRSIVFGAALSVVPMTVGVAWQSALIAVGLVLGFVAARRLL